MRRVLPTRRADPPSRAPTPLPGRVAEARGGKVLHHRDVDELPGTTHHGQHGFQVPRAAVWAEGRWRGLSRQRGP